MLSTYLFHIFFSLGNRSFDSVIRQTYAKACVFNTVNYFHAYGENVSFDKHDVNFSTMPTQHYKLGDYFLRLHKYLLKEWIAENKLFKCPAGTAYMFHGMSIMCEHHSGGCWIPLPPPPTLPAHRLVTVMLLSCWPTYDRLCFIPSTKTGAAMMGQAGLGDVSVTPKGPSHICPALSTPDFCDRWWPWFWRKCLFQEGEGSNPAWVISPKSILVILGSLPSSFLECS